MTDTGHAMTSWYYHNSYSEIYTVAKMLNIHAIDMKIIHQNIQNILVSTKFSPSADDRAHFFPYFVVSIFVSSSLFSSVSLYNFRVNRLRWNLKVFIIFVSYRIGLIILSTLFFSSLVTLFTYQNEFALLVWLFFVLYSGTYFIYLWRKFAQNSSEKCRRCINGRMSQP